ncbi:MAG: hypothetical protein J6R79_02110 [Bacteroidaceae bacterium]|nr:hypothetical protein [Bacteroidaceae bacterium]
MKYIFYLLIPVLSVLSFAACNDAKKNGGSYIPEFTETMTAKDTADICKLVETYFTFVINGEYEEAVGMLYRPSSENIEYQPELLNNEQIDQMLVSLKAIPVVGYNIEYIKINQSYDNEVMVNVVMIKGQNGMPDVTSKLYFKPINYLGTWFLTTMNSNEGDKSLVDADEQRAMMLKKELSK